MIALVGVVRVASRVQLDGMTLIGLAGLIEYLVRTEARMLEEGGYFDDGVFGYDFSEGYTSLESGAPKVRPFRESALKRWRRRRSDLRRERRVAREAAEERRMDEILEKIHREGGAALTAEENRFRVRVERAAIATGRKHVNEPTESASTRLSPSRDQRGHSSRRSSPVPWCSMPAWAAISARAW